MDLNNYMYNNSIPKVFIFKLGEFLSYTDSIIIFIETRVRLKFSFVKKKKYMLMKQIISKC